MAFTLLFALCAFSANARDKQPATIYAFGYSTCLSDSTSYLTAIAPLPGAVIDSKTHFLTGRSAYAYQLKSFLESKYTPNQTSVVFFATSRKELESKYVKLRRNMQKRKGFRTVELTASDFSFAALPDTQE